MIVLDTHIWYWWINADHGRLSSAQADAVRASERVGVSAVSCFEMAQAVQRGRIELAVPMREWFAKALDGSRIEVLPLTPEISARAVELTDHHRDPFDRIIIATAVELDARLASVDGQFRAYPELAGRLLA
jgi:PIN domain nuclease of toxin-antitoxin system